MDAADARRFARVLARRSFVNSTVAILLVWGIFVAATGVSGYVTKHHLISLIAGVLFGALIFVGGLMLKNGKGWGFWLGVVVTALMFFQFAGAYASKHLIWPAGTMALLSVLALIALFVSRRA